MKASWRLPSAFGSWPVPMAQSPPPCTVPVSPNGGGAERAPRLAAVDRDRAVVGAVGGAVGAAAVEHALVVGEGRRLALRALRVGDEAGRELQAAVDRRAGVGQAPSARSTAGDGTSVTATSRGGAGEGDRAVRRRGGTTCASEASPSQPQRTASGGPRGCGAKVTQITPPRGPLDSVTTAGQLRRLPVPTPAGSPCAYCFGGVVPSSTSRSSVRARNDAIWSRSTGAPGS